MRYRKKPIVIEAFQYDGDFMGSDGNYYVPQWAVDQLEKGVLRFVDRDLLVNTLEGTMKVNVGDYIIKGIEGELYPCREDIFKATYERVE